MPRKRERTVKGSCWPCKQRRVKCDLTRPYCRRCTGSGATCSFSKVNVRWNARPTKSAPAAYQNSTTLRGTPRDKPMHDPRVTGDTMKALSYFESAIWPLFMTTPHPCPSPISLALDFEPVLLSICGLAASHRRMIENQPDGTTNLLTDERTDCLSKVRERLQCYGSDPEILPRLLVAVLFLYIEDGFIRCEEQSASTISHQTGAHAIVEHLGGLEKLIAESKSDVPHMLLSVFSSTDLTRALLDDTAPCFPARVWRQMERGTVWWERQPLGVPYGMSLALIFEIMTEMAAYRESIKGKEKLCIDQIRDFERRLQPGFSVIEPNHLDRPEQGLLSNDDLKNVNASQTVSFAKTFQHTALIYLYRAICGLPARHHLVQQHVTSCMETIQAINPKSKVHNCIVFPVYVVGAHIFTVSQQMQILERLNCILDALHFNSLLNIRRSLEQIWAEERSERSWKDMFVSLGENVLVL
ncbi:Zn(II)2Cys6 transcription factor [Penicillium argentinense]|uniref:Zn(II)2Cys6 transcription factor n=1 Tax=Penicillium argentinense TaxID=1131581 RepID=A0A9W9KNQ4_9EURO|nr:Zn(II)2Cys6 transcription factor [Penicillium argentinense]KAJ5112262.1 Zn(II)2Cys6 transcription factor [Penicillium argentinense]